MKTTSMRVQSVLLLAALLCLWEGAVRLFKVPGHLVPPVSDIGVALWRGFYASPLAKDGFWYHGGVTLAEILLGFGIGSGVGLAIGILVSQMPRLETLLGPYVAALQLVNGTGTAGRAGQGDKVVVTFSDTMNPQSFCSTWSTSGDQSLSNDNQVTVSVNQAGTSDTLTC